MAEDRFSKPECPFEIQGRQVVTDGSIKRKLSGTMLGGVLGISPWGTPFTVSCQLLGLGEKMIDDKPAVKVGKALEGRIIEYLNDAYPQIGVFQPAEDFYEAREGPHASWASDFDDEDFTGHLDGIVTTEDGENYVLEVKTSQGIQNWKDGVPDYYFWQVALYNHFVTKKDKAYVALGVPDDETYRNPDCWTPSAENVYLFTMEIDQEAVAEQLEILRKWRQEVVNTAITKEWTVDDRRDAPLVKFLLSVAQGEDTVQDLVDEYAEVSQQIKDHEMTIAETYVRLDELKTTLKTYMMTHEKDVLPSKTGQYQTVLLKKTTRKLSEEKLKAAGLDPEDFMEVTVSETFRLKKNKE